MVEFPRKQAFQIVCRRFKGTLFKGISRWCPFIDQWKFFVGLSPVLSFLLRNKTRPPWWKAGSLQREIFRLDQELYLITTNWALRSRRISSGVASFVASSSPFERVSIRSGSTDKSIRYCFTLVARRSPKD